VSGWTLRAGEDTPDDATRFVSLSNSLYARPVTPAYYHWQFFAPPFHSRLMLAEAEDGTLAGAYGFHLRPAARDLPLAMALDIMVAPAWQGRGLFRALCAGAVAKLAGERPAGLYVMANRRAAAAHAGGLGWTKVQAYRDWVCPTGAARASSGRLTWENVASPGAEEDRLLKESVARRRAEGALALHRDSRWLRWRFAENPRYRYRILRGSLQGMPWGLLLLKTFTDPISGESFGDIVDVAWLDPDPALLLEALQWALAQFAAAGVPRASMWLQTNTALDAAGIQAGFTVTDRERFLLTSPRSDNAGRMEDPAAWFVTMADAEVY
jgi:GNAT superfamily N-acetyltransferase